MIRVQATLSSIGNGILMNPMTDEVLEELRTGVRKAPAKDRPADDVAAERVIRDAEGNPGIPAEYLFSCLVEAGRHVKNSKKQISTTTSSLVPAILAIEEPFLPFTEHSDWVTDRRRGCLPKDKTAVCLVRPKFERWQCQVTFEIEDAVAEESTVKELLRIAGSFIGLADFRPACRGPFGRFKVTDWVVLESSETAETAASAGSKGKKNGRKNGRAKVSKKKLAAAVS